MSWYPLRRLIVPLLLFTGAVVFLRTVPDIPVYYRLLIDWLPIFTIGVAILLSVYFNLARRLTAALLLLALYFVIQSQLQTSLADPRALIVYAFASVTLPLALVLLLFIREPGLHNRNGMLRAAIVPALLVAGWILANFQPEATAALIEQWLPLRGLPGSMLSLPAIACFSSALIAALWVLDVHDSEDAASIFSSLIFAFITLAHLGRPKISAVMLGAAGLAQIASLVRSSFDMAFRDELTGLLGRRAFNDRLKALGRRFTVAMLDVDHFKKFNDTYGHDVGDEVLKMVAKHIGRVRGGGKAYRYGGEEFSVIFPGRDAEQCEGFLEEIRRNVERYRLELREAKYREVPKKVAKERRGRRSKGRGEKSVSVTISIGVAERGEKHGKPEDVVQAADAALYRAKEAGRNQLAY